jgi:riboflavin synthase
MFTGLIETLGEIVEAHASPGGLALRISTALAPELTDGESLAVNGMCLTVARREAGTVAFDVGPATIRVTTVSAWRRGQRVNLERPMRADGRFGGHFVQGHVDATGRVAGWREDGEFRWLEIDLPGRVAPYVISRGSIAVDGISLTVADLADGRIGIQIVPFTLEHTSLRDVRVGDGVNLEADMIGKYVARQLELRGLSPALAGAAPVGMGDESR